MWSRPDAPQPPTMRVRFSYEQDPAGIAIGLSYQRPQVEDELADLRKRVFQDKLTGLPSAQALEDELDRHRETSPFSVLVIDFDGMRAADAHLATETAAC